MKNEAFGKVAESHIRALGIGQGTLTQKQATHRDPFEIAPTTAQFSEQINKALAQIAAGDYDVVDLESAARMERALSQETIVVPEGTQREDLRSMILQVADKKPDLLSRDEAWKKYSAFISFHLDRFNSDIQESEKPGLREVVGWIGDGAAKPIYADDPACAVKPALMQKSIRDW